MSNGYFQFPGLLLADSTGALVGAMGRDGKEYLVNTSVNTAAQAALAGYDPAVAFSATNPRLVTGVPLKMSQADQSGTPGNVTNNQGRGRAAIAAGTSATVVTNSQVGLTTMVIVTLYGSDATLTSVRVTLASGSFTVTGNANATAATSFDWFVIQN